MRKRSYICILLAAVCLLASCGSSADKGNGETVVRKETEQFEGYRPKETKVKKGEIFSKDGINVTLSDISYEDIVTNINLHVKNDMEEEVNVTTANLSINGLMCQDSWMKKVPAKGETDGTISISNGWLGEMEIEQIAKIEFVVKVYNSLGDEIFTSDMLKFQTDAPSSYQQKYNDGGYEIYNEKGVKLCARTLRKSALSDNMELVFYMENNTNSTITVMAKDVLVNDTPVRPLFVLTVGEKKKAVDTMVFYDMDLKENNITDIQTVTASFQGFNEDLETVFAVENIKVPLGA